MLSPHIDDRVILHVFLRCYINIGYLSENPWELCFGHSNDSSKMTYLSCLSPHSGESFIPFIPFIHPIHPFKMKIWVVVGSRNQSYDWTSLLSLSVGHCVNLNKSFHLWLSFFLSMIIIFSFIFCIFFCKPLISKPLI